MSAPPASFCPSSFLNALSPDPSPAPLPGARWYTARSPGQGLAYTFAAGALEHARYLAADLLLDGHDLVVFRLRLQEGPDGPAFELFCGALNQCQARLRLTFEALNQNRWDYPREGAWLKPNCYGARVDPRRVDRMTFEVLRKGESDARWCLTDFTATADAPPLLEHPLLPHGPLLDELGQSAQREWPEKGRSADEVTSRLHAQASAAGRAQWPDGFSKWGGWEDGPRFEATGFFRTHHDGRRWWLVDPEGRPFWSAGLDCVGPGIAAAYAGLEDALAWRPEPDGPYAAACGARGSQKTADFLIANLIRAFGPDAWRARWEDLALAQLRDLGFNTVGNWSDWQLARRAGFPYVRPLSPSFPGTPKVFRDFPDVWHPGFDADADAFAQQLRPTVDDPALVGYFLMNEPAWGFARESPGEGLLFNAPPGPARTALGAFLREKHPSDEALSRAWGLSVTHDEVAARGPRGALTDSARGDLAEFSGTMVERFFGRLNRACRAVDPHHLNLGARYYTVPPPWAWRGMSGFDVFSLNCYENTVPAERFAALAQGVGRPLLVGEWHFGALDAGLPASGIGRVHTQADRGRAYRVYLEDAAAKPWCVGAHYFTLYDESALGRFDGENYNIGFLDVCHRPYAPLAAAARASHAQLYRVASGQEAPFADAPEYLPRVFI